MRGPRPGAGGSTWITANTGRAASRLTPAVRAAVLGTNTARMMTTLVRIRTRESASSPAKAGGTTSAWMAKPARTSATEAGSGARRGPRGGGGGGGGGAAETAHAVGGEGHGG